jgi:hypothetical protein
MSGRIQLGFVDCIFIGDRACSLRFGAVVSGAKLVRRVSLMRHEHKREAREQ